MFFEDSPKINKKDTIKASELRLHIKIGGIIERNKITISSLLILTPVMAIPAYYDWRHPVIAISLGILGNIGIVASSAEQFVKKEPDTSPDPRTPRE